MKTIILRLANILLTGFAMYCIYDLENSALAAGVNGTQFMYAVAGIAMLGGVTLAPILDLFRGGDDDK